MLIGKVRCVVIRMPGETSESTRRRRQDALPWADPYILGLIDKLQREVRMEREAEGEPQWEDSYFEFDVEHVDEEHACGILAGDAPPPNDTVLAWPMPEDEDRQPSVAQVPGAGVRIPR